MSHNAFTELSDLRTLIIALSSDIGDAAELLAALTRNESLVMTQTLPLFESLCPSDHTLACLFVLWCWTNSEIVNESEYIRCASHFLRHCKKERINIASGKFLAVCRRLKSSVLFVNRPKLAVLPLLYAAKKFSQTSDQLTPLHVDFFQLCLLARTYSAAEPFLDCEFYNLDPTQSTLTTTDYLLYCYYGGRLCIGLKRYSRALEIFHLALVAPTLVTNAITIMVYKLYVLVSLLENGKLSDLPRFASPAVVRLSRSPTLTPYLSLADAYRDEGLESIQAIVNKSQDVFMEDNCLGLVKQVMAHVTKRDIKKLTRVYVSLSLEDITSTVGLHSIEETEDVLLTMVQNNEINVEINQLTGMVKFSDDTCDYDDVKTSVEINRLLQEVVSLGERMQGVREKIELDPEYLAKVLQNKQQTRVDVNDMSERM